MGSNGRLMVLDTAGLWFRAFHSVPERITGPDGAPVNAVRGFCDMTAALLRQYSPSGLVAALDVDWRPGWRVELLESYKAHRTAPDGSEDAPAALAPQIDHILELLPALGLTTAGARDAEADDVMADFAARPGEILLVTGDRDLLQLASRTTSVVYIGAGMKKQQVYTPEAVAEKYGLPVGENAASYADYAVLVGDASDGLPGVPGIGAKTAAGLLRDHGDLAGIVRAAEDDSSRLPARQRRAVLESDAYLRAAQGVVTLGRRTFDIDVVGDPDGRRGRVADDEVDRLIEATGQTRSIARIREATDVLESV